MADCDASGSSSSTIGVKQFKQVAKKSTSQLPQKMMVQNGHVRSKQDACSKSIARSDSCGQSDASDEEVNCHNGATSDADELEEDAVKTVHNSCIYKNNSNISSSVESVRSAKSSNSSRSALNGNLSELADKSEAKLTPVKTARLHHSEDDDSDGVVIVDADSHAHSSHDITRTGHCERTKRPIDASVDSCENIACKKPRLEKKVVDIDNSKKKIINRQTIAEWCRDFAKTQQNEEIEHLKKKIEELQESCERWKKLSVDLERQVEELRCRNQKSPAARSVLLNSAQVTPQLKGPTAFVRGSQPMPRSLTNPAASVIATTNQRLDAPSKLPPASARLAMPTSTTASSAPCSMSLVNATSDPKAVIDLTGDDAQVTPVPQSSVGVRLPFMHSALVSARPAALILNNARPILRPVGVAFASAAAIRPNVQSVLQPRAHPSLQAVSVRAARHSNPVHNQSVNVRHPAPLPPTPLQPRAPGTAKKIPNKPTLKLSRVAQGIVLSWNMNTADDHEPAVHYQLFAYQQGLEAPTAALWKKVGTVEALPLPMACTLTQFQVGNTYHFSVRAVDCYGRTGAFSEPGSIQLEAVSTS